MLQQINDLTLIKKLGKGSYGEVYLSQKENSNKIFATKKIPQEKVDSPKMKRYLTYEVNFLKNLNHPNIVKLEEIKKTFTNYYIVMEYINGSELSKCLKKYMEKYQKGFPEKVVQHLMKQIVEAVAYLHDLNIIHRDLKLGNIMVNFDNEKDKAELNMMKAKIKIIDFGFAIILPSDILKARSVVGTALYMDPRIAEDYYKGAKYDGKGYGKEVDIWSLGCLCYELFVGKVPFEANELGELVEKMKKGIYKIPKTASPDFVSFLDGMLKNNADYRLSARELLNHPFLTKIFFDSNNISANNEFSMNNEEIQLEKITDNALLPSFQYVPNIQPNVNKETYSIYDDYSSSSSFYSQQPMTFMNQQQKPEGMFQMNINNQIYKNTFQTNYQQNKYI